MTRCVLINLYGAHEWRQVIEGGVLVPKHRIPIMLHPSRDAANVEAVRLAHLLCAPIGVLELVDVVDVLAKPTHTTLGGTVAATEQIPTWAESPEEYLP